MAEAAAPATPAAPAPASAPVAPAGTPAPAIAEAPKPDADLLKQLTKASAGERQARALVAEMTKKLEAATGGASEAQKKAEMFDAVTKDPSLLLEHGVTWDQVLDAISGKKAAHVDPKMAKAEADLKALQDRLDARDKAEKEAKEAREKAKYDAEVAAAEATVSKLVADEGEAVAADGLGRWQLVMDEPKLIREAWEGVVAWMDEQKTQFTQAEALEHVRSALDQQEKAERERKPKLVARLKAATPQSVVVDTQKTTPQPVSKPRAELPPDRFTIDASTSGDQPPATARKEPERPKTRPARF